MKQNNKGMDLLEKLKEQAKELEQIKSVYEKQFNQNMAKLDSETKKEVDLIIKEYKKTGVLNQEKIKDLTKRQKNNVKSN